MQIQFAGPIAAVSTGLDFRMYLVIVLREIRRCLSICRKGHLSTQCSRLIVVICVGVGICLDQWCQNKATISSNIRNGNSATQSSHQSLNKAALFCYASLLKGHVESHSTPAELLA
jgi:hypothetical protein